MGIAAGPDGNLWFTEQSGQRIGRITTSGVITEFPLPGFSGSPEGITSGPDGNLWFTETSGNKIGRITTTGTITEFPLPVPNSSPNSITAGPDGNLWFTERTAGQIGKITPSGAITEFPLPTPPSYPTSIAAGPDGNLWFTEGDLGSGQIGRITPTGVITEFSAGLSPRAIALGPDGQLWFADLTGFFFPQPALGRISTTGTVTYLSLPYGSSPNGIVTGPDGNIWFTDSFTNGTIGRMTPAGTLTSYPIPTSDSDPRGITGGADGRLWFTERFANRIGRITVQGFFPEAMISFPPSVCPGSQGHSASVPDAGPGASYAWTAGNGAITGGFGTRFVLFSAGSSGSVALSITVSNAAGTANGTASVPISGFCPVFTEFPIYASSADTPARIVPGPDGNLWFGDTNNSSPKIGSITTEGAITLFPLPPDNSIPLGITGGPDGNVWYTRVLFCSPTSCGTDRIGRITPAGVITEFPTVSQPNSITAGQDGALWFGRGVCPGGSGCSFGRITTAGNMTEYPISFPNGGIAAGSDGVLWLSGSSITLPAADKFARVATDGSVLTEFNFPSPPFRSAGGTTVGPDGALWFTETGNNKIGRLTPAGALTEFPLPVPKSFPFGITTGPDGNLWFVENDYDSTTQLTGPGRIGQITPAGVLTEFALPTARTQPFDITPGPDNHLWYTAFSGPTIGRIAVPTNPPSVSTVSPGSGSPFGGTWVTVTGAGFVPGATLWFGDVLATQALVTSPTSIIAITPLHVSGDVAVVVTNPDSASGTLPAGFTYLAQTAAPTVSTISPPSGPAHGGAPVTIAGSGFEPGATVRIGDVAASSVNVTGPTSLTAMTGPHTPGVVDVSVTNPASASGVLTGGYTYVAAPLSFHTLTPCRVVDTRNAAGPLGGPTLFANFERTFTMAGQCGVPPSARAVSVNLTVTQPTDQGNVRLYPGGSLLPLVSSINYRPLQTRANNAVILLGAAGDIAVRCAQISGSVHFILDVNGYFE